MYIRANSRFSVQPTRLAVELFGILVRMFIMGRMNDAAAAGQLAVLLKTLPVADMVRRLRERFDLTQRQLALLAGLPHSKVAKIEAGQDVRLSTIYQLFAGLGCGLALLPVSRLGAEDLWRRTHDLCGEGQIPTIVVPLEVAVAYQNHWDYRRWRGIFWYNGRISVPGGKGS